MGRRSGEIAARLCDTKLVHESREGKKNISEEERPYQTRKKNPPPG